MERRRMTAPVIAVLAGAFLWAAPAGGQAGRVVSGTVVDSASHKPLSGAVIVAGRVPSAQRTAREGTFRTPLGPDDSVIVVRRFGYVPRWVSLPANAGSEIELGVIAIREVRNDGDRVAVEAEDLRLFPQLADFYRRRRAVRQGHFLTRDDLERSSARELSYALRRMSGLQAICLSTRQAEVDCGPAREATTYSGFRSGERPCAAEVWVNGMRVQDAVDDFPVDRVVGVEVYTQAGTTPREFGSPRCGVVAIWTNAEPR